MYYGIPAMQAALYAVVVASGGRRSQQAVAAIANADLYAQKKPPDKEVFK